MDVYLFSVLFLLTLEFGPVPTSPTPLSYIVNKAAKPHPHPHIVSTVRHATRNASRAKESLPSVSPAHTHTPKPPSLLCESRPRRS